MKGNVSYYNEKEYFVFILGYDLLQDIFKCSTVQECDYIYDFCNYEVEKFLKSKEYQNLRYSGYEMLEKWVTKNKKIIINDFKEFIGGEFMIYNGNIKIINNGFRREQPVAFVEKTLDNNEKEYIIAFSYKTKENKIFWDYGYYYGNDKNKAKKDFKKVLNGGNLDKTFKDVGER